MKNGLRFREAIASDLEKLQILYRQMHPTDPVLTDGRDASILEEIVKSSNLHIFLLCDADSIFATAYLNVIPNITRGAAPYAIIENVVTRQDMQRRGLGKEIVQCTLSYAWQRGCYKVMLLTGSRREEVHSFYRACGFDSDAKYGFVARPVCE